MTDTDLPDQFQSPEPLSKPETPQTILDFPVVVHDGRFHADEVFAVALLKLIGRWTPVPTQGLIRTRDPDVISANVGQAYIIDVGGVFDPRFKQFDHHQRTFDEYYCPRAKEKGVKMSSCGLVYQAFGAELFSSVPNGTSPTPEQLEEFYFRYIIEIDANDNGVNELEKDSKYHIKPSFVLPGIIGRLNGEDVDNHEEQQRRFLRGVGVCELLLESAVEDFLRKLASRHEAETVCDRGEVFFESGYLTWVLDKQCDYQYDLKRRSQKLFPNHKWVLTVLPRGSTGNHQVQTVSRPGEKFSRWVDLLDEGEARALINDDLVFVHANHFMGITKSREGAMKLAKQSIKSHFQKKSYGDGVFIAFVIEVCVISWVLVTQPEVTLCTIVFLFAQVCAAFFALC